MQSIQLRLPRQPFLHPRHATATPRRITLVRSLCPYQTLGVSATANDAEIKKAFRKLALQYHPDVSDCDDSHARFITIQQAYELLSGKARGKDVPVTQADWEWHDWYWNFCKSRNWSRNSAGKSASETTYSKPSLNSSQSKENLRTQLAGLRHRAAIRKQTRYYQNGQESTHEAGAAGGVESPATQSCDNLVSMDDGESEQMQASSSAEREDMAESEDMKHSDWESTDGNGEHSYKRHVPPSADAKSRIMQQLAGLKRNAAHAAQV